MVTPEKTRFSPINITELVKMFAQIFGCLTIYHRDAIEQFGQKRYISGLASAYARAFDSSNHLEVA